jgi:hypothetical protein
MTAFDFVALLAMFFGAVTVIGVIYVVSLADSRIDDEEAEKW